MKRDHLDRKQSALADEQGAILILLVFLATGLFAFIALGIDTGLLSVTRRDHAHMSPAVASAALNAFTESTGTFDQRLDTARLRAQEISQAAIDAAITSHFFEGHGYTAELGTASAPGATGFIEPGIWHFAPTYAAPYFDTITSTCTNFDPSDSCPWKSGTCEWNGPCFEPLDAADFARVPEPTVTAIRALLTSREEAPLRARFAQVFGGQSSFQMESSAIVAARPMRTIFIFDLSRSSHQETHLPYEMVGVMNFPRFNASEYAFRLQNKPCIAGEPLPPNNGSADLAYVNSQLTCKPIAGICGTTNTAPPLGPTDCVLSGGLAFSAADGAYNALFNSCAPRIYNPGKNPMTTFHTYHSKSDYRCVSITPTVAGVAQSTRHYLVDAFRGPTSDVPNYQGPEPFNTMLSAIRRGMERFDGRTIEGDRIAVLGVDHEVEIDQRSFPLTEPSPTDATYQQMQQLFAENAPFALRHAQHFWFPREDAMFNLPEALRVAYTMLTEGPEFHYSENQVILISDGLSECYFDSGSSEQICAASQAAVEQSLTESIDFITNNFGAHNIRFSTILIGGLVQPHNLVRKGLSSTTDSRCATEDETKNAVDGGGLPIPWIDPTTNSSSYGDATRDAGYTASGLTFANDSRYHQPNRLQQAVAATGGVWAPIRPPCQPTAAQLGAITCSDGGLEQFLDSECASRSTPGEIIRNIPGTTPIVDADGRLVCDPRCRNRAEQIEAAIDEIFDSHPYLAVQNNLNVY